MVEKPVDNTILLIMIVIVIMIIMYDLPRFPEEGRVVCVYESDLMEALFQIG